jgi:4-aminobutyrate aminotransferase
VTHVPYANCYRCPYNLTPGDLRGLRVEGAALRPCHRGGSAPKTTVPPEECAAIVVEPIQGEGGYIVPPEPRSCSTIACDRRSARHSCHRRRGSVRDGAHRQDVCVQSTLASFRTSLRRPRGSPRGCRSSATVARADLMDWTPGRACLDFGGNPVADRRRARQRSSCSRSRYWRQRRPRWVTT